MCQKFLNFINKIDEFFDGVFLLRNVFAFLLLWISPFVTCIIMCQFIDSKFFEWMGSIFVWLICSSYLSWYLIIEYTSHIHIYLTYFVIGTSAISYVCYVFKSKIIFLLIPLVQNFIFFISVLIALA